MELALFPLHLVLFPGRCLPLHLFEQRYREMLADVRDGDGRFGVVAISSGRAEYDSPDIHRVGTVAKIQQIEDLPDGRAYVVSKGEQRFSLTELVGGTSYLRGRVELLEDPPLDDPDDRASQLRGLLVPYLASLGAPEELLRKVPADALSLSWLAASAVQVELGEQQRLLELADGEQRLQATLRLLRRETELRRHFGSVGSLRPTGPLGADLN